MINKIILTVNKCRYLFHETFLSVKMIKLAHAFLVSALCLVVARVVGVCYYHSEPVCILFFFVLYWGMSCLFCIFTFVNWLFCLLQYPFRLSCVFSSALWRMWSYSFSQISFQPYTQSISYTSLHMRRTTGLAITIIISAYLLVFCIYPYKYTHLLDVPLCPKTQVSFCSIWVLSLYSFECYLQKQ